MVTSACCCSTCTVYFYDAFTRSDSSSLGSDWTEVAGDFSISSNALHAPGADAVAIWTGTIANPASFVVSYDIGTAFVANNINRIIIDYVDIDNYVCGEFQYTNATTVRFRIIDRVAGVETVEREWIPHTSTLSVSGGNRVRLRMSVEGTKVIFNMDIGQEGTCSVTIGTISFNRTVSSGKFGIGTGSTFTAGLLAAWVRVDSIGDGQLGGSSGNPYSAFGEDADGLYSVESSPTYCRVPPSTKIRAAGCDYYLHESIQLDVDFGGVSACGCSNLDGPYVLDFGGFNGDGVNSTAEWTYLFPAAVCSMETLRVYGNSGGGAFVFANAAETAWYIHTFGPIPDDCSDMFGGSTLDNQLCFVDNIINVPVVSFL